MARRYKYISNNYEFSCWYGNFQKLKYDNKKEDYFATFHRKKFYLNSCIRSSSPWSSDKDACKKAFNVIGTWQESYCVYELQTKENTTEFCEDSLVRVVYCPPSTHYVG